MKDSFQNKERTARADDVKYLKDTEEVDLKKIVHPEHIEVAMQVVKRLAMALCIGFLVLFLQDLPQDKAEEFIAALNQ